MQSNNPFAKPPGLSASSRRKGIYLSAGIHTGVFLLLVLAGLIAGDRETVLPDGGEFVSVEMVFFDAEAVAADVVPVHEEIVEQVEEEQEEVTEVLEELPVQEEQPVSEETELSEPTEEVQEEVVPPVETEFIGVGSEGEASNGTPDPASYEGRVFSSIRRNFRTSVSPARSYRITFTVNTDGTHFYEVIRISGDSSFDRAVTHALNSASIPPIPPGRTSPVSLQIEFFGPDS